MAMLHSTPNIDLDLVLQALDAGHSIARDTGIPGIGVAFSILSALVKTIQEVKSNHEGFNAVSREINDLVELINKTMLNVDSGVKNHPRGDTVVESLRKRGSSSLEHRVERFITGLHFVREKALELRNKPRWRRFIFISQDAIALKGLRLAIAKCRSDFESECIVAINTCVEGIAANVTQVKEIVTENSENWKLEHLLHAGASYRAAVNAANSHFVEGTREDVFKAIDDWADDCTQSRKSICILNGGAGTGKSEIACEFARRRCELKKDYGASFFFVRNEENLSSTRLVFPTLAYQLAESQIALRPHIVDAARHHRSEVQQMKFQAQSLIHGPVSKVNHDHPQIVLVIDAMDVCCESEKEHGLVRDMLELLIQASVEHAKFPLRIFLTCRPNSIVDSTLHKHKWVSHVHKILLEQFSPKSVQQDIEMFALDRLDKLPSGQALLRDRPDVVDSLVNRADGLFVYAKVAVDFLVDYPHFAKHGLDNLLSGGSSTCATELEALDDLYLTVLETAFPSEDQSWKSLPLRSTLGSLAVLRNPVSLLVFERLTGVPHNDVCKMLTPIRAVVRFDEKQLDKKVRVTHPTFSEFLLDRKRCMNELYYEDAAQHHLRLVVQCLGALQALQDNMVQLPDPKVSKAEIPDLEERLEKHVPEHVQYACAYWTAHLGDSGTMEGKTKSSGSEDSYRKIGKAMENFIGKGTPKKLRAWVEIMAYMGRLDTVDKALGDAQTPLKDGLGYEEVKSRLTETQKLVADNYSEIKTCPYKIHMV